MKVVVMMMMVKMEVRRRELCRVLLVLVEMTFSLVYWNRRRVQRKEGERGGPYSKAMIRSSYGQKT